MSLIEEIKKLTPRDILLFFALCLGVICPGILGLWMFEKPLLEASSAPKLLILAGAIGLPMVVLSTILLSLVVGERSEHSKDLLLQFFCGCMGSALACVGPLGMLDKNTSMNWFLWNYLGYLAAISLIGGLILRRDKASPPPTSNKEEPKPVAPEG